MNGISLGSSGIGFGSVRLARWVPLSYAPLTKEQLSRKASKELNPQARKIENDTIPQDYPLDESG